MALPEFTMRQLLEAGVHFGHQTHRWNPKMAPYIFGARGGVHIIDLSQTMPALQRALMQVREVAASGGRVLFVGTKRQAAKPLAEAAKRCGQYYVDHRWLGGMLTNWQTISKSIKMLKRLDEELSVEDSGLTKKELLRMTRQRDKLERALGGIRDMGGLPDVVFVIDTNREDIAINEAKRLSIPVVAILDTNCDPDGIAFPIPGNDDATRSIQLYCDLISAAVLDGIEEEMKARGADIGAAEEPAPEPVLEAIEAATAAGILTPMQIPASADKAPEADAKTGKSEKAKAAVKVPDADAGTAKSEDAKVALKALDVEVEVTKSEKTTGPAKDSTDKDNKADREAADIADVADIKDESKFLKVIRRAKKALKTSKPDEPPAAPGQKPETQTETQEKSEAAPTPAVEKKAAEKALIEAEVSAKKVSKQEPAETQKEEEKPAKKTTTKAPAAKKSAPAKKTAESPAGTKRKKATTAKKSTAAAKKDRPKKAEPAAEADAGKAAASKTVKKDETSEAETS